MRELFTGTTPLREMDYAKLFVAAEVARFTIHVLQQFAKPFKPGWEKNHLREEVVKEVKYLRTKCDKKEAVLLEKPFLDEVTRVLWDR